MPAAFAAGGMHLGDAGDGGTGATVVSAAQTGGSASVNLGGGGGGGAVGYIQSNRPITGVTTSPAIVVVPDP